MGVGHRSFHVWGAIMADMGLPKSNLFTMEKKPPRCAKYVQEKVFAIDFDEKSVRVSRCLNLIAGDGQTNVLHLNTLDYKRWDETTKQPDWNDTYNEGWKKLRKLMAEKNDFRAFKFLVLMANPPFAGDIKQTDMLSSYELAHKLTKDGGQGKLESAVGRDLLFIERNLDFLAPGGRMAVVLPQGRFNNSSDQRVREYIAERCRILAVVGLHPNTFKPHTGTKTSVLLVQKWNDDPAEGPLCPKVDDYNIFFATQRLPSKDNSGDKIYRWADYYGYYDPVTKSRGWLLESHYVARFGSLAPAQLHSVQRSGSLGSAEMLMDEINAEYGSLAEAKARGCKVTRARESLTRRDPLRDSHGHYVVQHDLFNHDGLTQDGIAEAFEEFAAKEKLSFF